MQDIFFSDAGEAPVPPDEVRIRLLEVAPRADGQRVDVRIEITPFQQRPNMELIIRKESGEDAAALSVVEAIEASMDFTMHLREKETVGHYTLEMRVFYADVEAYEPEEGVESASSEILERARQVVDQRQVDFHIASS